MPQPNQVQPLTSEQQRALAQLHGECGELGPDGAVCEADIDHRGYHWAVVGEGQQTDLLRWA